MSFSGGYVYLFRARGDFSLFEFFRLGEHQGSYGVGDKTALGPVHELVPETEGVVVGGKGGAAGE
jgi:hypothetical protein